MNLQIEKTIRSLRDHKIDTEYFETSEAAVQKVLSEIESCKTVGVGGSMTISSLGIPQKLMEKGHQVYFHWLESPKMVTETRRNALKADVYLTSTNALTQDGQLVNIDGVGNRVVGMIYGPKKVYVICGINKIVKNLDEAIMHIKTNTYKNARRLNLKTPCAITGLCNDCDSPERMCNVTMIIHRKPIDTDFKVIIIDEELGF